MKKLAGEHETSWGGEKGGRGGNVGYRPLYETGGTSEPVGVDRGRSREKQRLGQRKTSRKPPINAD